MDIVEANQIIKSLGIEISSGVSVRNVTEGDLEKFREQVCKNCDKRERLVGSQRPGRCYTGINEGGLCSEAAISSFA